MFFQAAYQGEDSTPKYLIGVVLVILCVMMGNLPLLLALMLKGGIGDGSIEAVYGSGIDQNLLLALIIIPFVFGLFGVYLAIRFFHRRPFRTVLTARLALDWKRIFLAFSLWFAINALFEIFHYFLSPGDYTFHVPDLKFIVLLCICLFLLPLQVTFEEVMFRGYLMQGLGRLVHMRWVPILVTSVLFGFMHISNPEVEEYGMGRMLFYYIFIGLILAVMTIMDDGLELALGMHAATNIYSAAFVSYEGGALRTDALVHSNAEIVDQSIFSFLIISTLFLFILSWIYKWKNWNKLFQPFQRPPEPTSAQELSSHQENNTL